MKQDITKNLHVGLDGYYKIKKNVLDEGNRSHPLPLILSVAAGLAFV